MRFLKTILLVLLFITVGLGWVTISDKLRPLQFNMPKGWPKPLYDFKQNPLTQEGFELGRKLFYDGRLSKDGNFPCASCHQQFAAFTTYDHNLSHGFNNSFTNRNAPPLFNLAWQKEFMLDGGINHLDLQPLAPLTDTSEMGENIDTVLTKLSADADYRKMFEAAFGDRKITTERMTKALSQFVLMMISANSKYDRVMRGEDTFTLPQRLGYNIYKQKCAACHAEPFFTDFTYRNAGLSADEYLSDVGRMKITRDPKDSLKFKVPTLRNVAVTSPYGHDGRFFSLLSVMNHYRKDTFEGETVDSLLKKGIHLSNFEIGQLTAFIYALTDSSFLKDPRFAPPGYENRMLQAPSEHQHTNGQ